MTPERFRRLRSVLLRRQPDLTVLMERVNKPHNFSAILRSCDAVGVLEAHAVHPEGGVAIHHDTAAGATRWVRVHSHPDVASATDRLRARGFQILAAHLSDEAVDFRRADFTRPTAVMMGAELFGVSEQGLEGADGYVTIPMQGFVESLNVSVAAALLLFEAMRQREAAGMYRTSRLDPEVFRRTLFEWAYPRQARILREQGRPYPRLAEDGSRLEATSST